MARVFPILTTDEFLLRELAEDDLDEISSIWGSLNVGEKLSCGPLSQEDSKEMLYVLRSLWTNDAGIRWGVEMQGSIVGTCGFHSLNKSCRRAEMGYELDYQYWGLGYMAKALRPIITYGFRNMKLERIETLVNVDNDRSSGLLIKLGFTHEGILRSYARTPQGLIDQKIFSLLSREWDTARNAPIIKQEG